MISIPSQRRPAGLRRSWLFTAGLDARAQQAAIDCSPDVVVADLEEFTALAERPEARPRVAALMQRCRDHEIVGAVRINRLAHDGLDDLQGVMRGRPDVVFLPYVESAEQIVALAGAISALEAQFEIAAGSTEIVPTIESALGFVRIQSILTASERITACLLAAEDLTADLGAERGPDSLELNHLRSRFLVECRAANRIAIDCPFNYQDPVAQDADLVWARRMGLRAKCAVYPAQVAAIHAALTPSEAQVRAAEELVARFEAFRRGQADGSAPPQGPDCHTARRLLVRAREFRTWDDRERQDLVAQTLQRR